MVMTWQKLVKNLLTPEECQPKSLPDLKEMVEQARQEWLSAQYYYNTVTDKDLVDHAVYMMQAAEKKYVYLLKQARQAGITHYPYPGHIEEDSKLVY
ncbi:DUF2508 family protein [Propionispora vibrioides]|jgi:hypothetical protein|uniref:Uncharacterized protein n=1 Tax=Propionispora vibrioides TaxID=112903 RepID=A0A1H8Y6A6_9FIRM|nr:DUF2508 family protein [Propionispora vibrioides]SEP47058.1 Protein of unknown function [Propionispora vibrioides]